MIFIYYLRNTEFCSYKFIISCKHISDNFVCSFPNSLSNEFTQGHELCSKLVGRGERFSSCFVLVSDKGGTA